MAKSQAGKLSNEVKILNEVIYHKDMSLWNVGTRGHPVLIIVKTDVPRIRRCGVNKCRHLCMVVDRIFMLCVLR